jgi:hypothetical protein
VIIGKDISIKTPNTRPTNDYPKNVLFPHYNNNNNNNNNNNRTTTITSVYMNENTKTIITIFTNTNGG